MMTMNEVLKEKVYLNWQRDRFMGELEAIRAYQLAAVREKKPYSSWHDPSEKDARARELMQRVRQLTQALKELPGLDDGVGAATLERVWKDETAVAK